MKTMIALLLAAYASGLGINAHAKTITLQSSCLQQPGYTLVMVPITLRIGNSTFPNVIHIRCRDILGTCEGIVIELPEENSNAAIGPGNFTVMEGLKLARRSGQVLVLHWGSVNTFLINLKNGTVTWTQDDGATGIGHCR